MHRRDNTGMALVSTILVMLVMSALLVGFTALIMADQKASGRNRDQTQAYAAAHAGLEKLTADLGALFVGGNFSPSAAQVAALTTDPPNVPGFEFDAPGGPPADGYTITAGALRTATIPNGPFQGLRGLITPYVVNVTAHADTGTTSGAEVRMRREVQTVAVPVFQFGIYSENDLSFFAGPDFDFGGRVHYQREHLRGTGRVGHAHAAGRRHRGGRGRSHPSRQWAFDRHQRPPRLCQGRAHEPAPTRHSGA